MNPDNSPSASIESILQDFERGHFDSQVNLKAVAGYMRTLQAKLKEAEEKLKDSDDDDLYTDVIGF